MTVKERTTVVEPPGPAAVTVTFAAACAAVGVPEMVPVVWLMVRPAGNVPVVTAYALT